MEDSLVSIIVPVYKAEKYLKRCVDSLIHQTYPHLEIILINDGSPDHSAQIIAEYEQKDNRVLAIHQDNKGVAGARNRALNSATGEFVMFVDSDDWLDLNAVQTALDGAEKTGADIVRFRLCYEYTDGRKRVEDADFAHEVFLLNKDFPKYIYAKMLGGIQLNSICRSLYRREILSGVTFNENMLTAEDLIFNMDAFLNANTFLYLALPLYHYYRSDSGLTGAGMTLPQKYKFNLFISKVLISYLPKWGMDNSLNKFLAYFRVVRITTAKIKREVIHKIFSGRIVNNEDKK